MTTAAVADLIRTVTASWVQSPDHDVVWSGSHEGRLGLRMRQQVRDFTTVWFEVGQRTVGIEAYLLPAPRFHAAEVYRLCLVRNRSSWPAWIGADRDGDLYVYGRVPLDRLDAGSLDEMVGAVYEVVELSFRRLVELAFRPREKSG